MPVRRPNIGASDPEEEQNRPRGPLPGRGTNQGRGAVDVADRTNQGLSDGVARPSADRSATGRVARPQTMTPLAAAADGETDAAAEQSVGTGVPNSITGEPSSVDPRNWSGLYDAGG